MKKLPIIKYLVVSLSVFFIAPVAFGATGSVTPSPTYTGDNITITCSGFCDSFTLRKYNGSIYSPLQDFYSSPATYNNIENGLYQVRDAGNSTYISFEVTARPPTPPIVTTLFTDLSATDTGMVATVLGANVRGGVANLWPIILLIASIVITFYVLAKLTDMFQNNGERVKIKKRK